MSVWPESRGTTPALVGVDGELLSLLVSVEPRLLEDLLDALARLDFPVNPELHHKANSVSVEFPAYSGKIDEVRQVLKSNGFDPGCLAVERALAVQV